LLRLWKTSKNGSASPRRRVDDTDVLATRRTPLVGQTFPLARRARVDRREFYWEDWKNLIHKSSCLLSEALYLERNTLPKRFTLADLRSRMLEATLTERAGHKVEIFTPSRDEARLSDSWKAMRNILGTALRV